MTEQQKIEIANEGVFLEALGINPGMVRAGSVHVEFSKEGAPIISYGVMQIVSPRALGLAFLASTAEEEETEEQDNVKPIKKAAAKKTAKKSPGRSEE